MKNCLILFIMFLTLGWSSSLLSQVSLTVSEETVAANGSVQVDITTSNFTNITLAQFSIAYDPSVVTFSSITNITSELAGFGASSFGTPDNDGTDPGRLTVSWSEPQTNAEDLPDGTVLFTIVFTASGTMCDETDITIADSPTQIQIADFDLNVLNVTTNPGKVMIEGTDCGNGGGGGDLLGLVAPDLNAQNGDMICVPIYVNNFSGVQALTAGIEWDTNVLSYQGIQNFGGIPDFSASFFNVSMVNEGALGFFWADLVNDPPIVLDIADGTVLFEACFDVIGQNGTSSPISYPTQGNFVPEFSDQNEDPIPSENVAGSVTVGEGGGGEDRFTLEIDKVEGSMGDEVCVNVTTRNFTDIAAMQYSIAFDPTVLEYTRVDNINLAGINVEMQMGSELNLSWSDPFGASVADNTSLYQMCFNVIGDCGSGASSSISFVDGITPIQLSRLVGNDLVEIQDLNLINGEIAVANCGVNYQVLSITNVECPGESSGGIAVAVTGASDDCECVWEDAQGNVVSSGTIGGENCSLVGQPAGSYTIKITCPGEGQVFTETETISEPDAISISSDVGNVGCGNQGSIDLTVTGGTAPYSYAWEPDLGVEPDHDNLGVGTYVVTVTDDNNCSAMASINITEASDNIMISSNVTPATDGNNGAIQLTVTGGDSPYTYSWDPDQGNTDNPTGLSAGTYMVTVTDNNGCTNTSTIEVGSGGPVLSNVTADSGSCSANCEGTISGDLTAGVTPVTFTLSGGPTAGTVTLENTGEFAFMDVCPGTYTLTAVDANNDQVVIENLIIIESDAINIDFEVECADSGESNGSIMLTVDGGSAPYDYEWSNGATTENLDNIPRGTYTVLVRDANGCEAIQNEIFVRNCDGEDNCYKGISIITPNGDNRNDIFMIDCLEGLDNRLGVYDRSGIRVFEAVNYNNDWDGTDASGNPLPEGSYMWALEVNFGTGGSEVYTGTVTVLRDY